MFCSLVIKESKTKWTILERLTRENETSPDFPHWCGNASPKQRISKGVASTHMAMYSCAEPNSRTIGKLSLSCFIQVFRYQNNNIWNPTHPVASFYIIPVACVFHPIVAFPISPVLRIDSPHFWISVFCICSNYICHQRGWFTRRLLELSSCFL